MKRRLIPVSALLLALLITGTAIAQEPADKPWSGGVSVGGNYSEASGDSTASTEGRWGPIVGGFISYRIVPLLSVALEVNWLLKGSTDMVTAAGDSLSDVRASYLEFPLTLNLAVPVGERWGLGVHAGIDYAIQTGISARDLEGTRVHFNDKENEWSVPLGAGVSYLFPASGSRLGLDVRYSVGLTNIAKDFEATNKSWQLFLRYGLSF